MPKSSKKDTAQCKEPVLPVNPEKTAISGNTEKAGTGSVDQIRDLLFGTQMQNYENRFNCMEEMVNESIVNLKEDTEKSLNSLESSVNKELKSLSDRLTGEKEERAQTLKELSQELKTTSDSILKTIQQLSDSTEKHIEELRQQNQNQFDSLGKELEENKDNISKAMDKAVQKLRHDTTDRAAFAEMLSGLADRIKNESTVPDPETVNDEK